MLSAVLQADSIDTPKYIPSSAKVDKIHFKECLIEMLQAWLPDGYSRIFRIVCVWPFGLLDYGSATLRCKI